MTHPLDAMAKAVPPGRAILLDDRGHVSTVIPFLRDPRMSEKIRDDDRSVAKLRGNRAAFGNWASAKRCSIGLTQAEFAARMGVGVMIVSRWERGLKLPPTKHMGRARELLGAWPQEFDHFLNVGEA
jgi:hypothetical protein